MADPVTWGVILTAAAGGTAAYGQYQAGKAQQYEYQRQAEQEKVSARDREIERRNRLLQALAQRNVSSAAGGASLEGSPIALINRDVREFSLESLSSEATTASRVAGLRAAGISAKRIGTINAFSSVFSTGASVAGMGAIGKKPPTAAPKSGGLGGFQR